MTAPKVPTVSGPWWWWRTRGASAEVVRVFQMARGGLGFEPMGYTDLVSVTDDGRWLCPVPTPDDIAARDAEVAALRVEVERLRADLAALSAFADTLYGATIHTDGVWTKQEADMLNAVGEKLHAILNSNLEVSDE